MDIETAYHQNEFLNVDLNCCDEKTFAVIYIEKKMAISFADDMRHVFVPFVLNN